MALLGTRAWAGETVTVDFTACPDTGSLRTYDIRAWKYGNGTGTFFDVDGVCSAGAANAPVLSATLPNNCSVVNAWIELGVEGDGNGAPPWENLTNPSEDAPYEFDSFFIACRKSVEGWVTNVPKRQAELEHFMSFATIVDLCPAGTNGPQWTQSVERSDPDANRPDGWGQAWQEWTVPSSGGLVCTRSVGSLG